MKNSKVLYTPYTDHCAPCSAPHLLRQYGQCRNVDQESGSASIACTVDPRNGFQDRISILRSHGIKLPNPPLAVHFLRRPQVRVQLVQNGVELFIRKRRVYLVGSVYPKSKGYHCTAIQFCQPLLYIGGVADFDVLRERGGGCRCSRSWVNQSFLLSFSSFFHSSCALRMQ